MKIDLVILLKTLGLPVGLVAVLVAILGLFGLTLPQVLTVAGAMVGLWALISLAINILKVLKVVDPGTAGKWNAALNLLALAGIAYILGANPSYDFVKLDAQLQVFAQFGGLILAYLINVIGTQAAHQAQVKGLGIKAFTFSSAKALAG